MANPYQIKRQILARLQRLLSKPTSEDFIFLGLDDAFRRVRKSGETWGLYCHSGSSWAGDREISKEEAIAFYVTARVLSKSEILEFDLLGGVPLFSDPTLATDQLTAIHHATTRGTTDSQPTA